MLHPIVLTFIAASTTILGGIFSVFFKKENQKMLSLSLSFSAGVMIYLSFVEILPKGLNHLKLNNYDQIYGIISFFIGLTLIIIIDRLTPRISHTHDHDTIHVHSNIEKIGFLTMFLITLHNFPEGMAVYSVAAESANISWPLVIAIAIHNIPEGIVIAAPIYFATGNRKKAIIYASLSALAEPIGGYLGYNFFKSIFDNLTLGIVFCFISGIMIFLSIDQLLPEARKSGDHHLVGYGTILGMLFMSISLYLLS